jgi:hypothetical protein
MQSNLTKYQDDLEKLEKKGLKLYYNMAYDLGLLDAEGKKQIEKIRVTNFNEEYQKWYTEALSVIKQVIPDRLADFVKLYKDEKRKETDYLTYTMSDYLIGLQVTRGMEVKVDSKAGMKKFEQQRNILQSAKARFESTLLDIKQLLQADLLDGELEQARVLLKNGYVRASGAVAGVVLEGHLQQVCSNHHVEGTKKNPCISDYNDALKTSDVYDIATWRFIQHLGDLRNQCDHKKSKEPKTDDITDLINGVARISKTIF